MSMAYVEYGMELRYLEHVLYINRDMPLHNPPSRSSRRGESR